MLSMTCFRSMGSMHSIESIDRSIAVDVDRSTGRSKSIDRSTVIRLRIERRSSTTTTNPNVDVVALRDESRAIAIDDDDDDQPVVIRDRSIDGHRERNPIRSTSNVALGADSPTMTRSTSRVALASSRSSSSLPRRRRRRRRR